MSQNWAVVEVTIECQLVWFQKPVLSLQVGLGLAGECGGAELGISPPSFPPTPALTRQYEGNKNYLVPT